MSSSAYIIFEPAKKRWWNRFLDPMFMHCFIIKPDAKGFIVINKSFEGLEVFTVNDVSELIHDAVAVKVELSKGRASLLTLNTCVSICKKMIGVNKSFIITPYQLYRHLRLNNG